MQEPESTGDIIDDVHAQEEHAKAIASTAEVSVLTSQSLPHHHLGSPEHVNWGICIFLYMHKWPLFAAGAVC